jgi:cytosine/adenosine deaminase-related metal-dependent hydrolase
MTLDAAYASFAENRVGSLVTGKKADFVVLDQDILTVPQDQILATKVKATVRPPINPALTRLLIRNAQVIDGQVTYGAL